MMVVLQLEKDGRYTVGICMKQAGTCKTWTLDSGLDHGLDSGLQYGLESEPI